MGSTSYSRLGFTPDPSGLTIRDQTRRSLAVSTSAGQPRSLRARSHRARVAQNCIVVGSMNEEAGPVMQEVKTSCLGVVVSRQGIPGTQEWEGRRTSSIKKYQGSLTGFLRLSSAKKPRRPNKLLVLTIILVLD